MPQKNIKLLYYLKSVLREYVPRGITIMFLNSYLKKISENDQDYILQRLNYCNKLKKDASLDKDAPELKKYNYPTKHSAYYFDFIQYARYFYQYFKCNLFKGDITHVPENPTFVKSRPINGENKNSVLLNLNKVRHFVFIKDHIPYEQKKDMLVWRGSSGEDALNHRKQFLKMYFDHPMCDVANANPPPFVDEHTKPKISINKHLEYKFVLCVEGIDVATNLKWVMSSNCLAVMPRPKYETWFMEGTLIPNHHYIEIRDDFTDLEEQLNYYITHPEEAQEIVKNAHKHVKQFQNKKLEKMISLLVLEKYFVQTGQMQKVSSWKY